MRNRCKVLCVYGLALFGVFFLICFTLFAQFRSATPGYHWANDSYYMLRANLNGDLREGWLWHNWNRKTIEDPTFEAKCIITGAEDGVVRWDTPMGTFWMPQHEDMASVNTLAEVLLKDVYDYRGRTVKPGDVVIDGGAHLGSFTRYALQKGAKLVVAIEPSSPYAFCLNKTFAKEIADGRVIVAKVALWDREDKLWLTGPTGLENSIISAPAGPGHGSGEWAVTKSIDQLMAELRLPGLNFLKMDIEGAEVEALQGARETIRRYRPFLAIATEHTDDTVRNVRNVIAMVKASGVSYKVGFGRYLRLGRNPYAPIETFFYR